MSSASESFTFKFIYSDGVHKLCAYIHHQLSFNELNNFLDCWVRKEHALPLAAPVLFWMDTDGDRFPVSNEQQYHMFMLRNPTNGVLWGTSNGVEEISKNITFNHVHSCQKCEFCWNSNQYFYSANGSMLCVKCNNDRGNCCITLVEGTSTFKDLTQLLIDVVKEKEEQQLFSNNNIEISTDVIVEEDQLKKKLENMFQKDTKEQAPTSEPAPKMNKPAKSTGAIPKRRQNEQTSVAHGNFVYLLFFKLIFMCRYFLVPVHVENAVAVMVSMGYNDKKGWLTRLLLSTNGNISDALDHINPASKCERSNKEMSKLPYK